MSRVAKRISETRKNLGLTQDELAERSKVNLRTIQRIENSESEPRGKTLNLICEVLQMDVKNLIQSEESLMKKTIGDKIIIALFLLALNLVVVGIVGYLTLDVNANVNSLMGALLLSFFLPFSIVFSSREMSPLERIMKFGFGYVAYFIMVVVIHGFPLGFVTGLFPCLLISLVTLYFGTKLIRDHA